MANHSFRTKRLVEVVDYLVCSGKVYNKTDFYVKIGKNKSQMSETLSGKRPVSNDLVKAIVAAFPSLNPQFFLDPDCHDMMKEVEPTQPTPMVPYGFATSDSSLERQPDNNTARLLAIIEKQQEQIDTLIKMLASK